MPKKKQPDLMSAAEVAKLKGVHRQSVHRAFEREVLKGVRIGKTYAIERESAEAWMPIRRQYGEKRPDAPGHRPKKSEG
jgi:excisionase family DNA binding protein